MRVLLALVLLCGISPHVLAAPTIALQSGVAQNISIPAGSLTNSYYFDATSADTLLTFELNGNADGDILLRYGRPFPDVNDAGGALSDTYLQEIAQYRALSGDSAEKIVVSKSSVFPVRQGRWFLSLINYGSGAFAGTIKATASAGSEPPATFEVVFNSTEEGCQNAPWDDATSASPVGGNSGTTRGQQRRNAMLEAARLLAQNFRSAVPVRLTACWSDQLGQGSGSGGVTLAASGPRYAILNTDFFGQSQGGDAQISIINTSPFLPRNHTWTPSAPASKLAGTRLCSYLPDASLGCSANNNQVTEFRIRFNIRYENEGVGFYYGLNPGATGGKADFVSTAMHEVMHGLGFAGFVNLQEANGPIGQKFEGYDDIYDANIADVRPDGTVVNFMDETDAQRADALQQFTQLRWMEAEAIASPLNSLRDMPPPENYVRLYTTQPIAPGSTLSHISFFHSNEIMQPQIINGLRSVGLAGPMLNAVGWSSSPRAAGPEVLPRSTQYFDPSRPGHGIDVQRVFDNVYFIIFYTYDANGNPEWYLSIGQVLDGVFVPQTNANGDSMVRMRYTAGGNPPQVADPNSDGQIRLDFNQAAFAPACRDGTPRDQSTPLVLMTWSIGAERNQQWCMQALVSTALAATPDFTGAWYAGNQDAGWGFSLLSFRINGNNGLFGLLFYSDAQGNGRWGFTQTANFVPGTTYTFKERRGYCRTCPIPASVLANGFTDLDAGTVQFTLNQASQSPSAGNTTTYSVTYQQTPGGTFARNNSPLILLSAPPQ